MNERTCNGTAQLRRAGPGLVRHQERSAAQGNVFQSILPGRRTAIPMPVGGESASSPDRLSPPASETRILPGVAILMLVVLFIFIVFFLRAFGPDATGFEQKGAVLVLYHASRITLAGFILAFCYCAGYRVLELFRVSPKVLFDEPRRILILCFFLGATLYGIAFTILGLAGRISLEAGLALTLPVLLVGYRPIQCLWSAFRNRWTVQLIDDPYAGRVFSRLVILASIGAAAGFLLTRVVYIPTVENNVWEHYLHYYRVVLASGSTLPNEVWHHFYASKGAGLIFLANVLSDFFGAQLASACFVLVAGVIILDLLLEYCRSTTWAFFGVMLFFTFLYGQVADGATLKHHAVILGYMSFALWGSVRLGGENARQRGPLLAVMGISFAYFGFYQPAMLVLLTPALVLLATMNAAFRERTHLRSYAILAAALILGGALAFWANWILTGLPEVTPMRWFWAIADREKAEAVFGKGGIEFFLAMNNDLATVYDWSMRRAWTILRQPFPLPKPVVLLGVLCIFFVLIRFRTRARVATAARILVPVAAFALPLSVFAQAVQTAAVDRVALYSIVLTTLASVAMLKMLVDAYLGPGIAPSFPVRVGVAGKLRLFARFEIEPWRAATILIIVLGMLLVMGHAWRSISANGRSTIYRFDTGALSLREAMRTAELPGIGVRGSMISTMTEFRSRIGNEAKILSLSYAPGFAYALPGRGIESEPTYSLIRDPEKLLASKPDEVADYLRQRRIEYFVVSLKGKLFSTIAFSSLFDATEMPRYFSSAYADEDFFILKWRDNTESKELSPYLLTLFELKRSGVLNYPFSKTFEETILKSEDKRVDSAASFEEVKSRFLHDLIGALGAEMQSRISLKTSRAFVDRIADVGRAAINDAGLEVVSLQRKSELRRLLEQGADGAGVRIAEELDERELKERFLKLLRDAIYEAYEAELGDEVAKMSRICDERIPFGRKYPASASC